jgi:hypothetical protein
MLLVTNFLRHLAVENVPNILMARKQPAVGARQRVYF